MYFSVFTQACAGVCVRARTSKIFFLCNMIHFGGVGDDVNGVQGHSPLNHFLSTTSPWLIIECFLRDFCTVVFKVGFSPST